MGRKTERYNWGADDITISNTVDLPDYLKKVVSDAPKDDKAKGQYLQGLVTEDKITQDDIIFLLESGSLT
jgi:hypothetical protein